MSRKKDKKTAPKKRGIINGSLNRLNDLIVRKFTVGFFANLIGGNGKGERLEKQSLMLGSTSETVAGKDKSFRRSLQKQCSKSRVINLLKTIVESIRACKLNVFGTYLMIFGIYSMAVFILKNFPGMSNFRWQILLKNEFINAAYITLFSIPLLFTTRSISVLISESRMMRGVFEDSLGVSEERFKPTVSVNGSKAYIFAIFFGILSGALTYFVPAITVIIFILVLIFVVIVMHFPEIGVLVSLVVAPLAGFFSHPTIVILACVGVTLVSYICKVAIGRRSFKTRFTDVAVLMFGAMMLLGGIVTYGGTESLVSALTYSGLISVYFLVVNLMNSERWLQRCGTMIALSSSLVALFGILSYGEGAMPGGWVDTQMFSEISNRAISTFSNPNTLATYLVMTAPFIWAKMRDKNSGKSVKILSLFGSVLSLVCVVLTWSRGGWLGYIAVLLVYLLINYRYTLKYLLYGTALIPLGYAFLPDSILKRFASIGSLADSSTYYRLFTWKGSLKMLADHLFSGIGVGTSAFHQIYPIYSYVGTEATLHSHNLFLEVAIELGIAGFAVFMIALFGTVRSGFYGLKKMKDQNSRVAISAGFAGLCAALVHGMVDYIWYNYRVFLMFWVIVAIICAYSRVCREAERDSEPAVRMADENEGTLNIIFREI